jgi:hypothetical protein
VIDRLAELRGGPDGTTEATQVSPRVTPRTIVVRGSIATVTDVITQEWVAWSTVVVVGASRELSEASCRVLEVLGVVAVVGMGRKGVMG